jgi:hypothetical protein
MVLVGHVDEISRSRIEGWAVDLEFSENPVSISIFVNGDHRGTCRAVHVRPGVILPSGEAAPDRCAFRHVFDPPLSPFIEHRVEVVETWSGQVLPNGQHTLERPVCREVNDARIPVLVTSAGRSGSTLLMNQFACDPDIVVGDRYPYEIKQIAYHAAAFRALVAAADRRRSTDPDTMFEAGRHHWIGANPYYEAGFFQLANPSVRLRDFYEHGVPGSYSALFSTFIHEFYTILAESQRKQTARFFCEKGTLDETVRQGARLFFTQVNEVVLVRDPRDLLCSMMAFWKHPPDDAMALLRSMIPQLLQITREGRPDTLVIRYEDLIREPIRTSGRISAFLGLDLLSPPATWNAAIPASHRTSESPSASIGRWRRELSAEQIKTCNSEFSVFMREFDYT